jgi:hypothetical protein
MTLTLMTIISGVGFGMAVVALVVATLAYARVVGMEKSTHRLQWMPVPSVDPTSAVNDLPVMGDVPKSRPKTLAEQMNEFMYPDVDKEQV